MNSIGTGNASSTIPISIIDLRFAFDDHLNFNESARFTCEGSSAFLLLVMLHS